MDIVFDETTEEALPFIPFINTSDSGIGEEADSDIPVITIPTITISESSTTDEFEDVLNPEMIAEDDSSEPEDQFPNDANGSDVENDKEGSEENG